jgi:hypothetical protein
MLKAEARKFEVKHEDWETLSKALVSKAYANG